MRWILRLGLGASIGGAGAGSMSWDEYVDTPPVQWHVAVEFAQRAADAMLEHAVKHARTTDPILVKDGERIHAAFTARVFCTYTAPNQSRIDRSAGPEEFTVDNVGVSIAVGRDACRAGAAVLVDFARGQLVGQQSRGHIHGQ